MCDLLPGGPSPPPVSGLIEHFLTRLHRETLSYLRHTVPCFEVFIKAKQIYGMSVADCRLKCVLHVSFSSLISRFIEGNFLLPLNLIFYFVRKRGKK